MAEKMLEKCILPERILLIYYVYSNINEVKFIFYF